jgi:hypothetical protein
MWKVFFIERQRIDEGADGRKYPGEFRQDGRQRGSAAAFATGRSLVFGDPSA